jgi:hypothetical protein
VDIKTQWYRDTVCYSDPKAAKGKCAIKFYFNTANQPKGRKFYWNHNGWMNTLEEVKNTDTVAEDDIRLGKGIHNHITEGKFSFQIDYHNLSDEELKILILALSPGDNMWHKLGKGKASGCGSIQINIKEQHNIDRTARYRNSILDRSKIIIKEKEIKKYIESERNSFIAKYPDLSYMLQGSEGEGLIIDGKDILVFYPSIGDHGNWFKEGEIPSVADIKNGFVCNLDSPYRKVKV